MCMKTCIHYSNGKLLRRLASYKACLCLLLCVRVNSYCTVWLLIFVKIKFSWISLGFLSMIEVLYAWCLRYNIWSTWFLDNRISICFCICINWRISVLYTIRRTQINNWKNWMLCSSAKNMALLVTLKLLSKQMLVSQTPLNIWYRRYVAFHFNFTVWILPSYSYIKTYEFKQVMFWCLKAPASYIIINLLHYFEYTVVSWSE